MSNFHLHYGISKATPPSSKTLRSILDAQERMNRACTWTYERIGLAPRERRPERSQYAFPLVRFAPPKPSLPEHLLLQVDGGPVVRFDDAPASGATRVRDNLWNAHLVAAFLRHVSSTFPELLFELRDDGGFVIPGSVWIRGGKVSVNRDWLNRERERVLETSGDPQAAMPFIWAEAEALAGRFFADAPAADFGDAPEIRDIGTSWDELQSMSLEEAADHVVNRVVTERVPAVA